jgi:hypothetical protein
MKELMIIFVLLFGAFGCLLWTTRLQYPKRLNYKLDLKFRVSFNIAGGIVFGFYVINDQNSRTHATTIWRIGIGFLCFNPELEIIWMNR